MREMHESQATRVKPADVNPIIRLGWFHYAFAIAFLSLAFFQKIFDMNDFDTIKNIVCCIYHVSAVAPWNLQEIIHPTNDPSSSTGLVKAILPSKTLWQSTIDGDGTPGNPGIPHLNRGGTWLFSEYVYFHPGLYYALRFFFFVIGASGTHWKRGELFMCIASSKAILYLIISGIAPHCALLCKYKGDPGSVKPSACIQITIGSDQFDPIGSLIRNNGNMDEAINFTIE